MFGDPYTAPVLGTNRAFTPRTSSTHITIKPPQRVCQKGLRTRRWLTHRRIASEFPSRRCFPGLLHHADDVEYWAKEMLPKSAPQHCCQRINRARLKCRAEIESDTYLIGFTSPFSGGPVSPSYLLPTRTFCRASIRGIICPLKL